MFNLASLPAVALAGTNSKAANFDQGAFCALVERWPEAQRFPRMSDRCLTDAIADPQSLT